MRIGNASGFYGDRLGAFREMLEGGELDVLTGDYLAELTMLILGKDRARDPETGYAKTFLRQMRDCLGLAVSRGVKIVVNAGGLNPAGLARAIGELDPGVKVGYVTGDDLLSRAEKLGFGSVLTANAYLGAFGIAACLRGGADVVVTGRVTDASLVVGPAAAYFGWARDDFDALAGATVAGHVLECGTQATGGNFAFFTEIDARHPGFPIAEIDADGSSVITKHPGTGGAVTVETVTAQLLYEIGAPAYLGPDVVTDFTSIRLADDGPDRVGISRATGTPPPPTLKVATNVLGGFRNAMTFVLCGLDIDAKADLTRAQLEQRIGKDGLTWRLARTDHADALTEETASALLHVSIADPDPARAGRAFSQAAVELALGSYPGFTLTSPPSDATPYGIYKPAYVPATEVPHTAVLPTGDRVDIPPPPVTAGSPSFNAGETEPGTTGETRRAPLGTVLGARSGDKGGDANLGVWARTDAGHAWMRGFLTVDRFKELLPETGPLVVHRYELPNLKAVNFVVEGLLGEGVASSTRFDPQAKALGEWLRSRVADIPVELL